MYHLKKKNLKLHHKLKSAQLSRTSLPKTLALAFRTRSP